MKNWLTSLNGALTLSVITFLTFLGRTFMDWRYEYPQQDPAGNWDTPMALIYMALIGGLLWGLLVAARGRAVTVRRSGNDLKEAQDGIS